MAFYKNNTNGEIEFILASRERCLSVDNLDNQKTEELLFATDSGTIITNGVEFGKGTFIPSTDDGELLMNFGNIPKGTKISDLKLKSISEILEDAFFTVPINVSGSGATYSTGNKLHNLGILISSSTNLGTVSFKGSGVLYETKINGEDVEIDSNGYYKKQVTLADLQTDLAAKYPGVGSISSISSDGTLTSGTNGFNKSGFVWNFDSEEYTKTLTYTFSYKTKTTGTVKSITADFKFTLGGYITETSPSRTVPTMGICGISVKKDNATAQSSYALSPGNSIAFSISLTGKDTISGGSIKYVKNSSGQMIEKTGENAWEEVGTATPQSYKSSFTITDSDTKTTDWSNSEDIALKSYKLDNIPWTNSNGAVLKFLTTAGSRYTQIIKTNLVDNKYLRYNNGVTNTSDDYSGTVELTTSNNDLKETNITIKAGYDCSGAVYGQTITLGKIYTDTTSIPFTVTFPTAVPTKVGNLVISGIPSSRKISSVSINTYKGLNDFDKLNKTYSIMTKTLATVSGNNIDLSYNHDVKLSNVTIAGTINITKNTNTNS